MNKHTQESRKVVTKSDTVRNEFEKEALKKNWCIIRCSAKGDYRHSNVEYAFIGYCMALGIDYLTVL